MLSVKIIASCLGSVDLLQVDLTSFSASEASFLGREAAKSHIISKEGLF